jgi:hypothetical protein
MRDDVSTGGDVNSVTRATSDVATHIPCNGLDSDIEIVSANLATKKNITEDANATERP